MKIIMKIMIKLYGKFFNKINKFLKIKKIYIYNNN